MPHPEIWNEIKSAASLDDITSCLSVYFLSLYHQGITKERDEASRLIGLHLITMDLQGQETDMPQADKDQILSRLKSGIEIILMLNPTVLAAVGYNIIETYITSGEETDLAAFLQKQGTDPQTFLKTAA